MSRLWVTPEELESEGSSPYAYEACKTASFILWVYSGRKYNGTRTVTERYDCACRSLSQYRRQFTEGFTNGGATGSAITLPGGESLGLDTDGVPYFYPTGITTTTTSGGGSCGCVGTVAGSHQRLRLRGRPVRSVQKVVSGSGIVDPSKYQVVNSSVLQPAPGASLDVCGLEVTYSYGLDPPAAGRRAARYLAREFTKMYSGSECDLPDRVTSISRQGVSYTILDNQTFIDDLRTGVYAVDLFLKAVNPDKARKPARVFSPDMPRVSRATVNVPISAGLHDMSIVVGSPLTWSVTLSEIHGELLSQTTDWVPQGQITSWNGALLLEFTPDRFTVQNGVLTLTLTGEETSRINIGAVGVWDLYAVSASDQYTVVHVMTSNVHPVG